MLLKQLTLSSERVLRRKPYNYDNKDEILFKREFIKNLPNIFPILKKNSYIPPCGRLLNGLSFNLFQFSNKLGVKGFLKLYLKFFLFLAKTRKITRLNNIIYITTSNSQNFFHWFLDVLQKLEFIDQSRNHILNFKFKIIIPNGYNNSYSKKSLEAFDLNFYYQEKNEIIISNQSILLPNIAPTGNYRKSIVLKLNKRMRNHWSKNLINIYNNKRIYISRRNAKKRKLKNEDEIIPILKKHGFIILDFDKLNFEEQLKNILNSEILVSIHGAGLTHMLWMNQKSKVLEIRARDNSNDNCYFTLASDLGHDYFYVTADKTNSSETNHLSDLVIKTEDFSSQLIKML
jgi:capsular polysaccharide biosynthesis protein